MCVVYVLELFCSPGNSSFGEIVNGNFYRYLVAGENFYIVHTELARNVSGYDVLVRKLHLEYGVRQSLNYRTFKFNNVILWQNNPSLSVNRPWLGQLHRRP